MKFKERERGLFSKKKNHFIIKMLTKAINIIYLFGEKSVISALRSVETDPACKSDSVGMI